MTDFFTAYPVKIDLGQNAKKGVRGRAGRTTLAAVLIESAEDAERLLTYCKVVYE